MTEAGIYVVTHDGEVRYAAAILGEIAVDDLRVAVVAGDQAKRRVGVFVNAGMESGVDPGHNGWEVLLDAGEHLGVRAGTGRIPVIQSRIARIPVQMNLSFHQHQIIRFDSDAGPTQ